MERRCQLKSIGLSKQFDCYLQKSREDAEDERCLLTVGAGPSLEGQGETQSFFAPRSATLTPPTNIMVGNSDEQNSVADTLASAATESSFTLCLTSLCDVMACEN